jgi:hypothetical protein
MLLVKKTEKTKNILWMPDRCRNFIPVSKSDQGNRKKVLNSSTEIYVQVVAV